MELKVNFCVCVCEVCVCLFEEISHKRLCEEFWVVCQIAPPPFLFGGSLPIIRRTIGQFNPKLLSVCTLSTQYTTLIIRTQLGGGGQRFLGPLIDFLVNYLFTYRNSDKGWDNLKLIRSERTKGWILYSELGNKVLKKQIFKQFKISKYFKSPQTLKNESSFYL